MWEKEITEYVTYGIVALIGLGTLLKIINSVFYQRLWKQSQNIAKTKNKFLKRLKQKFEHYYQVNIGVSNIHIFVEKYRYQCKVWGWNVYYINKFILYIGMLVMALSFLWGGAHYFQNSLQKEEQLVGVLGIIGGLFLVFLSENTDAKQKNLHIINNIEEYFTNVLAKHLAFEYEERYIELRKQEKPLFVDEENEKEVVKQEDKNEEEAVILNTILQEYFS